MNQEVKKFKFFNPTKGNLSFQEVVEEVLDWIKESPDKSYELVVGCDSSSGEEPDFPVAIVLLRKGEGGRFFLKRVRYRDRKFKTWRDRILQEVLISCDVALALKENLGEKISKEDFKSNLEFKYIHADVGGNGITKDMIREVIGLIRSNGFEAKIKPESYAASIVADRFS